MSARAWERRRAKTRPEPNSLWWVDEVHHWIAGPRSSTTHTPSSPAGLRPLLPPRERPVDRARRLRLERIKRRKTPRQILWAVTLSNGYVLTGLDRLQVECLAEMINERLSPSFDQMVTDIMLWGAHYTPAPWSLPDSNPLDDIRAMQRQWEWAYQPFFPREYYGEWTPSEGPRPPRPTYAEVLAEADHLLGGGDAMTWSPGDPTL